MSALENLPPDQRAVLQLVLQRGRSYDEIAQLLSIERSAVRQRALDAFQGLTPATALPGPEHALVTDYLLGQLPERVAEQVYAFLQASEADRAWAVAVAEVIGPLAPHALPEIPAGGPETAEPAAPAAAGGFERDTDAGTSPAPIPADEQAIWPEDEDEPRTREARPVSRRGGAILLSLAGLLIAAAIIVATITSGGGGSKKPAIDQTAGSGRPTSTSTAPAGSNTGTVTTGTVTTATNTTATNTTPQILAQLNLRSPTGAGSTVGIVQVVRDAGLVGIVIDAQGVPANTAHNAYAVWLYNSPSSHRFVGFVPTLVSRNGNLTTEGTLPAGAASYHRLLVTLETQSKPASPGKVVLSGPFREHP